MDARGLDTSERGAMDFLKETLLWWLNCKIIKSNGCDDAMATLTLLVSFIVMEEVNAKTSSLARSLVNIVWDVTLI